MIHLLYLLLGLLALTVFAGLAALVLWIIVQIIESEHWRGYAALMFLVVFILAVAYGIGKDFYTSVMREHL